VRTDFGQELAPENRVTQDLNRPGVMRQVAEESQRIVPSGQPGDRGWPAPGSGPAALDKASSKCGKKLVESLPTFIIRRQGAAGSAPRRGQSAKPRRTRIVLTSSSPKLPSNLARGRAV